MCGDLAPNSAEVWTENLKMPYLVKVNQQGFRMAEDIAIPKIKQRVLCLGDSFTFSPYLPNHDTYPALLSARVPEMEVINAGVGGYTITDEAGLFIEKAKYVAPDITVLQVLDNDITDLFWFHRNEFDRSHKTFRPSKNEQEFIDIVIKRNAATNAPSAP